MRATTPQLAMASASQQWRASAVPDRTGRGRQRHAAGTPTGREARDRAVDRTPFIVPGMAIAVTTLGGGRTQLTIPSAATRRSRPPTVARGGRGTCFFPCGHVERCTGQANRVPR